jgi:TM2 domain-containing membrane protein YozV
MTETTTRRYLAVGAISAALSLFVLPIAGLASIYSGYKVYGDTRAVYSYLLAGVGALSILFWISYLGAA